MGVAETLACVASVSVRFRRKERGTRVKDREKSGSRFISRAVKTESLLPRYFFAPKPNGNACYAGYGDIGEVTSGWWISRWKDIVLNYPELQALESIFKGAEKNDTHGGYTRLVQRRRRRQRERQKKKKV